MLCRSHNPLRMSGLDSSSVSIGQKPNGSLLSLQKSHSVQATSLSFSKTLALSQCYFSDSTARIFSWRYTEIAKMFYLP